MLYLLQQLIVPLALAAVFGGGLAGWSWHCIRHRAAWAERDGERNRLRNELLGLIGHLPANDRGYPLVSPELDSMKIRLDAANDQLDGLRRELASREEACADHHKRIAELEIALQAASSDTGASDRLVTLEAALRQAEAKAAEVERRAAALEADLDATTTPKDIGEPVETRAMRWKSRYLESRVGFLEAKESLAVAATVEDRSAEVDAAHARIAELEASLAAPPVVSDDDLMRERWRSRYLDARVRYLEGEANTQKPVAVVAPPAEAVDAEADNRKRWRQRYLEARVAWLEGRLRDAGKGEPAQVVDTSELDAARVELATLKDRLAAAESRATHAVGERARIAALLAEKEGALSGALSDGALATRRAADLEAERARHLARIAELENAPSTPAEDPDKARNQWRTRYLDNRVRYLEQSIALAPKAPTEARQLAPRDDSFAPLEPAGAEVRPAGLPAARGGAPDDLRMIAGVGPRIESTLNSLGVYHFDQIAQWTPANIDWIERYLAFKGRIGREKWIEQAKALARGEETEGRRRYLEGEHV